MRSHGTNSVTRETIATPNVVQRNVVPSRNGPSLGSKYVTFFELGYHSGHKSARINHSHTPAGDTFISSRLLTNTAVFAGAYSSGHRMPIASSQQGTHH